MHRAVVRFTSSRALHFRSRICNTTSLPFSTQHRHSSLSNLIINWRPYSTEKKWSYVSAREAIAIYEKVTGYKLVQEKKEEEEEMGSHGSGHDDQHTQSEKHQPQTSSVGHSTPPTTEHAQSKPIFLDLRSSEDVKQFWIDGFLSVPFNKLKDHIKEDKLSKNVPIYLIDLSGYKSEKAADILAEAGFQHIHVIEGGLFRWVFFNGYLRANRSNEFGNLIEETQTMMQNPEQNVSTLQTAMEKIGIRIPPVGPIPDIRERDKDLE